MVPKGTHRAAQNELKIELGRILGQRWGTKAPQEVSGSPPTPKMTPKPCQNGTKNEATTLLHKSAVPLSSSEIREKLAYIPSSAEEREEAGIQPEQRRAKSKPGRESRTASLAERTINLRRTQNKKQKTMLSFWEFSLAGRCSPLAAAEYA